MDHDSIVKQSIAAYKQWCEQWREHAAAHKGMASKSFEDFRNVGIGKALLLVANGYSFEENIETIKKHQKNVDIMCCDKTLGSLLDNGITPTYCMVCDANVDYEKYMKPWENKLHNTILFQNVCGNPKWTHNGNWKDKYFYVNKDVMNYEKEFMQLSGCKNTLTAGTNVSNMMVVVVIQSDNNKVQNLFCYDKLILIGYDYSWKDGGKYYAFDQEAGGKQYYMRHVYGISPSGKLVYTSNNLSNSGSWLKKYIETFRVNAIQCSRDSIHAFAGFGDLEEQMQYSYRTSDRFKVNSLLKELGGIEERKAKIENTLRDIAKNHWYQSKSV